MRLQNHLGLVRVAGIALLAACTPIEPGPRTSQTPTVASDAPTMSPAEQELERLQARTYSSLGMSPPRGAAAASDPLSEFETDVMQQFIAASVGIPVAEVRRSMERNEAAFRDLRPPTRFESPVVYRTIRMLASEIERASQRSAYPTRAAPVRPLFGTLPTGQVDAVKVALLSGDGSLVLIHSGLFPFADLMSRVISMAAAPSGGRLSFDEDRVRHHLASNPYVEDRFRQVLEAYLLSGRTDTLPPSVFDAPLDGPRIVLATILLKGMGLFVIGHEYGHVFQGPTRGRRAAAVIGGAEVDTLRYGWNDELEADQIGAVLTYLALENPQRPDREFVAYLASTEFFFRTLEMVERGASVIACGAEDRFKVSDHPPTAQRRQMMRRHVRDFLRRERSLTYSERAWQAAVAEARKFDRVMEILWERSSPALLRLHRRGTPLAPSWRTYKREGITHDCSVQKISMHFDRVPLGVALEGCVSASPRPALFVSEGIGRLAELKSESEGWTRRLKRDFAPGTPERRQAETLYIPAKSAIDGWIEALKADLNRRDGKRSSNYEESLAKATTDGQGYVRYVNQLYAPGAVAATLPIIGDLVKLLPDIGYKIFKDIQDRKKELDDEARKALLEQLEGQKWELFDQI